MKQNKERSFVWMIALFMAAVAVLWPLFRPGFFITDDGEWMIIRLSAFYQSLAEGQFPVRFLGRLNHSYGYPVTNFLYPGFLYIGSVLHRIGFSFVDSVKVILGGSVVGSALLIHWGLRRRFSVVSSLMGALGFLFTPYILFDVYKRGSVGEILAVFAAVLTWFSITTRKAWILPWAVALLLVSHNSLALLFILLIMGYLLTERVIWRYSKPLVLGIGMAAFSWFPAMYERRFVLFDTLTISNPQAYFIGADMLYLLNIVPITAAIILLTNTRQRRISGSLRFWIVVLVLTTILTTPLSGVLWKIPMLGRLFQFPYRLLAAAVLAGPWIIASVWSEVRKSMRVGLYLVFGAIWFIPWWMTMRNVDPVVREEGYYTTNEATTTVADEYMPRWVTDSPRQRAEQAVEFFAGRGNVLLAKHSTQTIDAVVEATEKSTIQINKIYYPGWGVSVDGQPRQIDYNNSFGLMRVVIPGGRHQILGEFRETALRFVADIVSLASIVFAFVFTAREFIKRREQS